MWSSSGRRSPALKSHRVSRRSTRSFSGARRGRVSLRRFMGWPFQRVAEQAGDRRLAARRRQETSTVNIFGVCNRPANQGFEWVSPRRGSTSMADSWRRRSMKPSRRELMAQSFPGVANASSSFWRWFLARLGRRRKLESLPRRERLRSSRERNAYPFPPAGTQSPWPAEWDLASHIGSEQRSHDEADCQSTPGRSRQNRRAAWGQKLWTGLFRRSGCVSKGETSPLAVRTLMPARNAADRIMARGT